MTHDTLLRQLAADRLASRIWARDPAPFQGSGGRRDAILARLGWLDAPAEAAASIAGLAAFAEQVRADGLTEVVLLGMGGSSLCAEVLRDVPGPRRWNSSLTVLDTTDERAIRAAASALDPTRTLFIVASKSGTTVEVDALERWFWTEITKERGADTGRHFIAITDPDTPLATLARTRGYRHTFVNAPDIGGRYSALSLFGLVPGALLGLDLARLVSSAQDMAARCRTDDTNNPGLVLGAFMAALAAAGRDKLTLLLSPELRPIGPWIEQLVAESTGKHGRGVLPIVDEPAGPPDAYGADRMFVASRAMPDFDASRSHPTLVHGEASAETLGAEIFRWEFATAVAGAALGVNPFDEPNVREAKQRTQAQLDARRTRGAFALSPPLTPRDGVQHREHGPGAAPKPGEYLAILDYLPADPARATRMHALRAALRARTGLATTYGVGPRYLHSTGQYHKGGPNTGRFAILTADDATETPVPGTDYSFSVLKFAQALGDFEALAAAGRRVVHWHLGRDDDYAAAVERLLATIP